MLVVFTLRPLGIPAAMADTSDAVDMAAKAEDVEWCYDIVQDVSRTFAITVDVLEEPMSSSICIGYLLCRIPDTIEDARHIPPETRADLLDVYDEVVSTDSSTTAGAFEDAVVPWIPEDSDADWELLAQTPRVLRVFESQPVDVREAIRPAVREMVDGMATFLRRYADEDGIRIQTREELHEYCHYAAGVVGELVTNLVRDEELPAASRNRLTETADSFGHALQLVNVAKDVGEDYREEDNVYLPVRELATAGVAVEDLGDPDTVEGVVTVVERTIEDARGHLDDAQTWLEHVPERAGNRVAAWSIPYLLAVATLREIESRPADVLRTDGVKVDRSEVGAVIEATVGGLEEMSLGELRREIAAEPLTPAKS